jgi:hypothetical protein
MSLDVGVPCGLAPPGTARPFGTSLGDLSIVVRVGVTARLADSLDVSPAGSRFLQEPTSPTSLVTVFQLRIVIGILSWRPR